MTELRKVQRSGGLIGAERQGHVLRLTLQNPPANALSIEVIEALLAEFAEGLLVVELIGQGVNGVTGDYSRGAVGFMVRAGEIAEPVAEITIASNLIDMFATLEPASDLEFRRGIDAPTILVPEMTVGAA